MDPFLVHGAYRIQGGDRLLCHARGFLHLLQASLQAEGCRHEKLHRRVQKLRRHGRIDFERRIGRQGLEQFDYLGDSGGVGAWLLFEEANIDLQKQDRASPAGQVRDGHSGRKRTPQKQKRSKEN